MNHVMSPTGVAALLMLALVIDWLSIGADSWRDRIAFVIAVVCFRQGFNGSQIDQWTVGAATSAIDTLKDMAGGAYIAGASTQFVVSAAVGVLTIYAAGCLWPDKWNKRVGKFAAMKFPAAAANQRINVKLWILAAVLGMTAELPGGFIGTVLTTALDALTKVVSILPNFIFGV